MNFNVTEWALNQLPRLGTPSEKLVLINLSSRFNNDENYARPGIDRIAADLGIEPRSVKRALKNLSKIGILQVQFRHQLNLPSLYFLNFDFCSARLVEKVTPQTQKIRVGVTKSQSGGDKKSPPGVTKSHPNKQENKLLKKQQQPDVVVFEKLFWEKPLTSEEKTGCEFAMKRAKLPAVVCQKLADEMAGAGRKAPINNPVGWMASMIVRCSQPGFCFAHAATVAASRAGRAAQAARESLALPPPPRSAPPVRALSQAGRAELTKMGRHPKPAPPQVEATHPAGNLTAAICQSAIAVTDLSGEARMGN